MISEKFIIRNLKICSINNAYATKDRRKSKETREWLYSLKVQMMANRKAIENIKNNFMRKRHFITIDYYWFVPEKEYFTKKGELNTRCGDWSNFAKIPDDMVFDVLGIDDGSVAKGTVYKLPYKGQHNHIMFEIKVIEIDMLHRKTAEVFPEALR